MRGWKGEGLGAAFSVNQCHKVNAPLRAEERVLLAFHSADVLDALPAIGRGRAGRVVGRRGQLRCPGTRKAGIEQRQPLS